MASPQLEHGFTRIANEILEALARDPTFNLKSRMLILLIRESYGRGRKDAEIGYSEIAKRLNASRSVVVRVVKELRGGGYIFVRGAAGYNQVPTSKNRFIFQKDYHQWGGYNLVPRYNQVPSARYIQVPSLLISKKEKEKRESQPTAKAPPPIVIPYQEFLETWNANAGALPHVLGLSKTRRNKIRDRWLENPKLDYWIAVVRRMAESSFCQGKNDRNWRADFGFMIENDTNHLKVMEGKYDNKRQEALAGKFPSWM